MTRRHDIDALRALAFSLLILYHFAMLYVAEWGWHLKSTHTTEVLHLPMIFVNRWRMDLIFLISGFATAYLMRAVDLGEFLRRRLWRLLLPLLFGMAVVVPIQPYCQGVANGLVEPGFLQFLQRYFTGYDWPRGAFDGWQYGFTWNHLWYLAYVLCYTLVLAALRPLLRVPAVLFGKLAGWRLLVYPALPILVFAFALSRHFPSTHDLINDWHNHAVYFTMFIYGWALAASEAVWRELARLRRVTLALALAAFTLYYGMREVLGDPIGPVAYAVIWAARILYMWLAIAAMLGWAHAHLNRPMRWLPFANEAVYPWYILHQSLIVWLAYLLMPFKLGPVLEPILVLTGTVAGCWLLHVGVIRRVAWLRPCFGMKRGARRSIAEVEKIAA